MSTDKTETVPERTTPLLDLTEMDELDSLLRQVPQATEPGAPPPTARSWMARLLKWIGGA